MADRNHQAVQHVHSVFGISDGRLTVMSRAISCWIVILMLVATVHSQTPNQKQALPAPSPESSPRALLDRNCVTCHNQRLKTADLTLDNMDVGKVNEAAPVWEKVVRKLRARAMPPAGMPRPD